MRIFPKRKLTEADGEYILWHILTHLEVDLHADPEAIQIIRDLLDIL